MPGPLKQICPSMRRLNYHIGSLAAIKFPVPFHLNFRYELMDQSCHFRHYSLSQFSEMHGRPISETDKGNKESDSVIDTQYQHERQEPWVASWNHRVIKAGRNLPMGSPSPHHCLKQTQIYQGAEGCVQSKYEYQGRRFHSLSRQPVPMFEYSHDYFFPLIYNFPFYSSCVLPLVLSLCTCEKSSTSLSIFPLNSSRQQ